MDLKQYNQDFELDRMKERVNEHERVLNSLRLDLVKKIQGQNKLKVSTLNVNRGVVTEVDGEEFDVEGGGGGTDLPNGSAANRFLVWNTTEEEWEASELKYPAGTTTNRYLVWDAANAKWAPGELAYPAGDATNTALVWDNANGKWIKGETTLAPSTVDGHVLETYDDAGVKKTRWGYVRMKDI